MARHNLDRISDAKPAAQPTPRAPEDVERLAALMDSAVRIPVIGYRIGLDGLLGLFPVIGDAATLVPAGYILYRAKALGVPNHVLFRMAVNTGADTLLGSVPLIGDLFDFAFKSNRRNVELLRRHVGTHQPRDATPADSDPQ
jgi:hypothetical protein